MARYKDGLLGGFQGTVGPVVGASWKGISYMRSRQRKSNKPRSPKQLEQQAKFSLLQSFLLSIRGVIMQGFNGSAIQMTGINSAYAYNYRHAISGAYPAFTIDYAKILVSLGQLISAADTSVTATGNSRLRFNWAYNSGIAMANADDRSMIVVHCPELNRSIYTTAGSLRSAGSHQVEADMFAGKTVETWLAFVSADGADVATSIYTGQVSVV